MRKNSVKNEICYRVICFFVLIVNFKTTVCFIYWIFAIANEIIRSTRSQILKEFFFLSQPLDLRIFLGLGSKKSTMLTEVLHYIPPFYIFRGFAPCWHRLCLTIGKTKLCIKPPLDIFKASLKSAANNRVENKQKNYYYDKLLKAEFIE